MFFLMSAKEKIPYSRRRDGQMRPRKSTRSDPMSRRPARFTQADLSRAIRAIAQAEANMMVEVLPDGTMRILPAPAQAIRGANPKAPERTVVL
jgi:hypothetical protein